MAQAKRRGPRLSGAKAKATIVEARAVLDVLGYNSNARFDELAGVVQGLALELQGNREFSDLRAFFSLAARAFEANIIRRFARDIARSQCHSDALQDRAKDAQETRDIHRDFTFHQAKLFVGISELNRAKRHASFLQARDTLTAMRTNAKVARAAGKTQRKAKRQERDMQGALKVMRALNPTADPVDLEKSIRETMKPA